MEMVQQLKDRYAKYVQEVGKVYQNAKPMDGLFGWGDDPRKDPCHMRFYEDVEQWAKDFLAGSHDQTAVFEAVSVMLNTPAAHKQDHAFWFLYAAQGMCRDMIPLLSREQCAQLRDFYDANYPKCDRMPVQKEIYKLLQKSARRA